MKMNENLDRWLKQATRRLSDDSAAQVRRDIRDHYECAREAAIGRGASEADADGMALAVLAPLRSPLGEIIQAVTVAVALSELGRVAEAATTWAVCELGFDELSSPPSGSMLEWYEAVRASLSEDDLAAARRRAAQMGMERGLAWVGQVARGEIAEVERM